MKLTINDEELRIKIVKLEQIFNSQFGEKKYGFFGQLFINKVSGGLEIEFCSFANKQAVSLKDFIVNRKNKSLDEEVYKEIEK